MDKINSIFWCLTLLILITIPLGAGLDTIFIGLYSFQKYFWICYWEGFLLYMGLLMGVIISKW